MTACHDPACTAQTIEETGSHFLPAIGSPIEASNTRRPLRVSRQTPKLSNRDRDSCSGPWHYRIAHHGAVRNEPVSTYRQGNGEFARQRDKHDTAYARRLPGSPRFIPARQRAAALILLPEPGNLDQDTAPPAVACLGDALAAARRAAVIGARRKPKIRTELPPVGEGSHEDLACQDRGAGLPNPPAERTAIWRLRSTAGSCLSAVSRSFSTVRSCCSTRFRRTYSRSSSRRNRSGIGCPSLVVRAAKSIRDNRSFGSTPRIPWPNSNPLMRLI